MSLYPKMLRLKFVEFPSISLRRSESDSLNSVRFVFGVPAMEEAEKKKDEDENEEVNFEALYFSSRTTRNNTRALFGCMEMGFWNWGI